MDNEEYDIAVKIFSGLINIDYNNALYHCHFGRASILNGDLLHGLGVLKNASDIFKASPEYSSLSKSNKGYIRRELTAFFNVAKYAENE